MVKFLHAKFSAILDAGEGGENRAYLQKIQECLQASNAFMSTLYKSGLFLSKLRLTTLVRLGQSMLRTYSACADLAYGQNLARFKLNPKYHMLAHICLELQQSLQAGKRPLNPISYSCQMPEDFINKIAILSRSVSGKTVAARTIDLYRMALGELLEQG